MEPQRVSMIKREQLSITFLPIPSSAAKTKSDRWNIAGDALLSPANLVFQPRITVRVPVFFVLGFTATIDYGNRNRIVRLIR